MDMDVVGQNVLVTLIDPPGRMVQGVIVEVVTNPETAQALVLRNALFRDTGHRFPTIPLPAANIKDISTLNLPPLPPPIVEAAAAPAQSQNQKPPPVQLPVDPAIVSVGKSRPTSQIYRGQDLVQATQSTSHRLSTTSSLASGHIPQGTVTTAWGKGPKVTNAARLNGPFSGTDINGLKGGGDATDEEATDKIPTGPKSQRKQRAAPVANQPAPRPPFTILRRESKLKEAIVPPVNDELVRRESIQTSVTVTAAKIAATQSPKRSRKNQRESRQGAQTGYSGKGWRQSPMLKEAGGDEAENSHAPSTKSRRRKAQKGRVTREDRTGWATEDATDIQEMGDFDFEGNLGKFDKKGVFEQLRREDVVPEEQRLVGHNKIGKKPIVASRPGTFGGTKLHPTENVLDVKPVSRRGSARQRSLSSDTSSQEDVEDIRAGSRLSSRLQQKRFPKKTSSTNLSKMGLTSIEAAASTRFDNSDLLPLHVRHTNTASSTSNGALPRMTPSESEGLAYEEAESTVSVNFYVGKSRTICPVITPGGMSALEDLAISEHKLKLQTINENAGRSLAEIVLAEFTEGKHQMSTSPTAIFLVGNHRAGARALVAARHMRNRGFKTVCCVLGLDRPGSQLDVEVDKQLRTIRRTPEAVVANWREVHKYLLVNEEQGYFADVWIDALLAPGHSYDTLVPEDQNAVRDMVAWTNKRPAGHGPRVIFSIDTPCGINASNGEILSTETSSRVHMHSSYIVSMGAPRTGLLVALRNAWSVFTAEGARNYSSAWTEALLTVAVYVVDIGINEVWRAFGQQLGLATGSGVDFGMKWYRTLRLDTPPGSDQELETE
ncbi:YjeF N-terminal domain-like protein [Microthyrium microscopicum]|uniref:Enhancer of mRNA-decapping protein 3 n=1 Tax=Microthyrium microscopicum TaxID=703497 RepID=A0A6A6UDL6_9PEZI|nr:YjeF N-terminal domain-like protein [Microthyrium microscopicum]